MANLRLHHLSVLLLITACQSSTEVDVEVANVVVDPAPASVEVGLTLQFQASAFDAAGAQVTGQSVTWESTVPGIASVSASGVATGLAVGSTEIRATVGGVTGSQTLSVDPTLCGTRTDVTLSPGAYMSFPGDECLLLPAGAPGDVYRVAIVRPTLVANASNTPSVTLDLSPVLTAATASAPVEAPAPAAVQRRQEGPRIDGTRALEHLRMMDATRRFHTELRLRERDLGLDPSLRLPNLAPAGARPALTSHTAPPPTRDLYLDLTCNVSTPQPVRLIGFDDNLAIYQETAEWNTDPVSPEDATELLFYFDRYVMDMVVSYWGALPDTDANGRMIVTTTPSLEQGAAAAVFSGDFYQRIGPPGSSCASSNEGEVIYFQGDILAALDGVDPDPFGLGVVAHEAKHVVSLYNGIQRGPNPPNFNDLWIEEGTAEISQVMSSRIAWAATGGPAVGARITGTDVITAVQANGGQETAEMSAFVDALAGLVYSLSAQPNSVITDPNGAPDEHSFYANSWHWHRFLGDAFGNASTAYADSAFFRELTSSLTPAGGASGEIQITGRSFEQLFEDFVVALSLHQTGHNPTYAITTWDFVSTANLFSVPNPPGSYPWPVTADDTNSWDPFESASYTGNIGPSGVRFHDFRSSGTAGAQIRVVGSDQPCDQNGTVRCDRIIVTRIN